MNLLHTMRTVWVLLVLTLLAIPFLILPFLAACAGPLEAPGLETPGLEAPGPDPTIPRASELTEPAPTPAETAAVPEVVILIPQQLFKTGRVVDLVGTDIPVP